MDGEKPELHCELQEEHDRDDGRRDDHANKSQSP
jgi:hypothetical protein